MNGGYEHYLEGCVLLDSGDYSEAVVKFSESFEEMPHFKTYERLGECYTALGDLENSFDCVSAAYSLNPRSDKTALRYAELLIRYKNDFSRAREVLAEILARNPSYKPARILLDEIGNRIKER